MGLTGMLDPRKEYLKPRTVPVAWGDAVCDQGSAPENGSTE